MRAVLATLAVALSSLSMTGETRAAQAQPAAPAAEEADPFLWLEEVEGERALAWVRERNQRSLATLQGDPRYQQLFDQALSIATARDRIPPAGFAADGLRGFWQDRTHVRGIWRRTSMDSYRTAEPTWDVILDVDALSASENANWVFRGAGCLEPRQTRCLVSLSNGGKDAVEVREFDVATKSFVPNGFRLPESKGSATWVDENTLLIARDFGEGTLTDSGYPMVVKRLTRGQPIEQARELIRGQKTDVSVSPAVLRDADGVVQAIMMIRAKTFYEADYFLMRGDEAIKLPFPQKISIQGLVGGRLVATLEEDWQTYRTGDLIGIDLDALKADPQTPRVELILRPTERQAIQQVATTRNKLVVALTDNVRGQAWVFTPARGGWPRTRLNLPDNSTVGIGSTSDTDDRLFLSVTGYLEPSSLYLADAASGSVEKIKSTPARFDASNLTVSQFEATSTDGTKIPYFVVHRKDIRLDGSNPTLLYGYGGYQVSLLPSYSGTTGKLWLERGGVYVVANTRGGGEFGPRWHQAAQRENRQKANDDFAAVARDLIDRRITSPRRLGIQGGSQGGLFVGTAMTQHPELFNAVVIQVPLFDMMRFHRLLAGASWIAEYGNPDIPEERAWIRAYSPYQNLRAGQRYPEPFILTSTKDDRVHPGHARKAAAKLESLGYPYLYYENIDGGHSAAANLNETAKRVALEYTYLTRKLMD